MTHSSQRIPLMSAHADGNIRIWDIHENQLLNEYNVQIIDDEGLTTIAKDDNCQILMVGGSRGHIRIINLKNLISDLSDPEKLGVYKIEKQWKAHMLPISSVSYVKTHNIILSSSKDCCVR